MQSAHKPTVLDTCCLINLYASQRLKEIIRNAFGDTVVPRQVAAEGLFLKQPADDDPSVWVSAKVSLQELVEDGMLRIVSLDGTEEIERFVELAMQLDDGEAACLAIASLRGFRLATDDRKAIRIADGLNVEVVTTPEIVMSWDEIAGPPVDEIATVIQNIELYGHFRPRPTAIHFQWWCDHAPKGQNN